MRFLKIYWEFVKMFIKSRLQYKISFFVGIFTNFYCYLITFLSFWVITRKFGNIGDWNFYEICVLYGLNLLTYALAAIMFWPIFRIETDITNGNLDTYLIKPMGALKQLICKQFGDTFLGQVVVALGFIIYALINIDIQFSVFKIIFIVLTIISGILIQSSAMIVLGSLSFWSKRSSQLGDILYYDFRKFTEYPISVFPMTIKMIVTFILPWGLISYYPSTIILGKSIDSFEKIMGIITPGLAAVIFYGALRFFECGLRRYEGSGS